MDRPVTFEPNARGELASSGPRWKPVRATGGMQPVKPHDLLWITDRDLVVTWLNPAAADFLGRAPAECIGRSVLTWLPGDLRRECERSARSCLGDRTSPGLRIEGQLQDGQGRALEVEWSLDPLYGARAELQGFACWASDLSERRLVEARLAECPSTITA
jgi:PAS domain S-box-containing protein